MTRMGFILMPRGQEGSRVGVLENTSPRFILEPTPIVRLPNKYNLTDRKVRVL